jgi:hypothetical protein
MLRSRSTPVTRFRQSSTPKIYPPDPKPPPSRASEFVLWRFSDIYRLTRGGALEPFMTMARSVKEFGFGVIGNISIARLLKQIPPNFDLALFPRRMSY